MSEIAKQQVHNRFKVFTGPLASDNTIGPLAAEVAAFASSQRVAAKSIGVEYIESAKRLIITLGYREDEEPYPIKLDCVNLGKADVLTGDFAALEEAMIAAASGFRNIICHELYVTDGRDFLMVFLTNDE